MEKTPIEREIAMRDRLREELNWLRSRILTAPAPYSKETPYAYKVVALREQEK